MIAFGGLWAASGGLGAAPGDLRGPLGDDFQAAVDSYFRCSPRGSRGFLALFWGGFWHKVFVLSRRVAFRLKMLSSGLSWLFGLRLETQAFDLKQAVVLQVMFRLGKKQPLKNSEKRGSPRRWRGFLWLSFLSLLEAIFAHFDVNFWLRRSFAFDALLGALVAFWALWWGGSWHLHFVLSRCVCFRLHMFS